jgi:hypothetical protein
VSEWQLPKRRSKPARPRRSPPAIMPALATALGVGSLLLVPALVYLYRVFEK